MAAKRMNSYFLNEKDLLSNSARNLRNSQLLDDEVDLAWISEAVKQDLNSEELDQVLHIIDDFIEQKKAEAVAEIDLAKAFKILLIEKYALLKKDKQIINGF